MIAKKECGTDNFATISQPQPMIVSCVTTFNYCGMCQVLSTASHDVLLQVALIRKNNQHDDVSEDSSLFSTGSWTNCNSSLLGVPKNKWENPSEIVEASGVADRDMSCAISARLPTQHHNTDANIQVEDLESGMEHQVESQLRTTTCKQCCSMWKSLYFC